jgi:hypothetical protein
MDFMTKKGHEVKRRGMEHSATIISGTVHVPRVLLSFPQGTHACSCLRSLGPTVACHPPIIHGIKNAKPTCSAVKTAINPVLPLCRMIFARNLTCPREWKEGNKTNTSARVHSPDFQGPDGKE